MSREIMQQALSAFEAIMFEKDAESCQLIAKNARYALREELAKPEQEQEPYCWVQSKLSQGMFYKEKPRRIHTIPLYTAPPRKEWVDLTTAEINAVYIAGRDNYYSDIDHADVIMIARALEAKLREKK